MKRELIWTGIIVLVAVVFASAEYKPNGDPLHVCVGAIPLEPNTDKLPQIYLQNTKWDKDEPHYVLATTLDEFQEGLKYFPDVVNKDEWKKYAKALTGVDLSYKKNTLHIFYFNGKVHANKRDVRGIPAPQQIEVFGIERLYIPVKKPGINGDAVIIHILSRDIGRIQDEHTPGIYYEIPFDKLDTEDQGTPPITVNTTFEVHELRAVHKTLGIQKFVQLNSQFDH